MENTVEWFKEAKYGMMIHWGLYSLLAGEYRGEYSSHYAEWIQSRFQIPNKEYEKLAEVFQPIYFDADQIVTLAKECGMTYLVVTTKHHDGFAMYHSKADKYNICDATPFGRDVIRELADACRREGLKFGIYYSQDLDWHEEHGGGYLSNDEETAGTTWDNSWDFPDVIDEETKKVKKDYSICFEKKILPQVREIMSEYGEICTAWFDVPMTLTLEQSRKLYDTVKELQPNCLINSRIGNGMYDYVSLGDNEIPEKLPEATKDPQEIAKLSETIDYNAVDGFKPSPNGLYETAATMNHSWGYSAHDQDWKPAETIYQYKKHLNDLGINYLLNVGLDPLGRIPAAAEKILREVKQMEGCKEQK